MPRLALPVAAVMLVAVAFPPALAADHTITASDFTFSVDTLTIVPGDPVPFANAGVLHNFEFEDGPAFPASPTLPGAAWNGLERVSPPPPVPVLLRPARRSRRRRMTAP